MNINTIFSIYVKRIVGTLILIAIVSMPNVAQLARLRDDIYLANESSMNVALKDISSKSIRYKNEKNKTRKLKSTEVLVIFNKVGEFIIFPKENLDPFFIKDFLSSSILPQSDIIVTLNKNIIFSDIVNKEEEYIQFHNLETKKDYQKILKNEIAAIIYKNGSHELLVNPAEAVRILASQNSIIQNYRRTGVILRPKAPVIASEVVLNATTALPEGQNKVEEIAPKIQNIESNLSVSSNTDEKNLKLPEKPESTENNIIPGLPKADVTEEVSKVAGKAKIINSVEKNNQQVVISKKPESEVPKSNESSHISEATAETSDQNINAVISQESSGKKVNVHLKEQNDKAVKTASPEDNSSFTASIVPEKKSGIAEVSDKAVLNDSAEFSENKVVINHHLDSTNDSQAKPSDIQTAKITASLEPANEKSSDSLIASALPEKQTEVAGSEPTKSKITGSIEKLKVLFNNTSEKIKSVLTADLPLENEDGIVTGTKSESIRSSSDSIFVKGLSTTLVPSEEEEFYTLNTYDPTDTFQLTRRQNKVEVKAEISKQTNEDKIQPVLTHRDEAKNESSNASDIDTILVAEENRIDSSFIAESTLDTSSYSPSVKVTNVTTEYPDVDLEQFNHHALFIKRNLDGYLSFILDKNSDEADVKLAIDETCKMFISESTWVEVSNNGGLDYKVRFRIRDFLNHARLLKYKKTDITWMNVNYVENLGKGPDGSFYGLVKLQQKINKFNESYVLENSGYRKNSTFLLKGSNIESGSKEPQVFLSDFGIIVSKEE